MKTVRNLSTVFIVGIFTLTMAGCATPPIRTVPLKVQSDPLGAYVVFQVQADKDDEQNYDWVYLGNTPLDTRRAITSQNLENADAFMIRIMKEGYLDQQKAWTGDQMVNEVKDKGAVFWNPKLIPAQ